MTDELPPQAGTEGPGTADQRAQALQAQLEATRGLLDAISEAIYVQDAEGRFLDVNDGAVRMYGHPRSFLLGQTPAVVSAPGRNDLELVQARFQAALAGQQGQFEFWGLRANGEVFPKDVRVYPGTHLGQPVVIAVAQDISERKRAEHVQTATYLIAEAALQSSDTHDLLHRVHGIVRELLPAENLYIALWDKASDQVSFPYWVDTKDPAPAPRRLRKGLTEYVMRQGVPLLIDGTTLAGLEATGEVEPFGTRSLNWLGVPLGSGPEVFGALVVQSYQGGYHYTPQDRNLLAFVSGQVAMAIARSRAQAEHRLLSAAMDTATDPIFGMDAAGRFQFVNQAACRSLGFTRAELQARSVWDIDPRVTPEGWQHRWERLQAEGSNREETLHRRRDGTTFPVEISSTYLAAEGQARVFTHARDISARTAAEAELRASEEKFSKAFQSSPDAININRLDGTYVEANAAFTRMSGWTLEETLGRTTLELGLWANPDDRVRMQEQLQKEGQFSGLEAPFRMKDGSLRTGLVSGTLIQMKGETCLLTVTRDITDRKEVESALRYSEDKFSRAFHASPDAINLTRLDDGTYLDVSEGFEKISGWTREEAIGRSALELRIWGDPRDRERAVALIRSLGEFTGMEFSFRRKDGTLLTGLMSGKVMEVDGIPCLLSVTRDISERKGAEAALHLAEQRLRTVLANSQAVIYQLDAQGTFLLSEGLGLSHLGLRPGQVVGLNALDLYGRDVATRDQIRRALAGAASREVTEAGGRLWDNLLTPVFGADGQVEGVIGIATDVTEQHETQQALLAERNLFTGGPVMVIRWRNSPGWPVDYLSPNVQDILGYSPEALTSGRVDFHALVHPEDVPRIRQEGTAQRQRGTTHYHQEYRLRHADGTYRWFYDYTGVGGALPDPPYFLGYLLDITEQRQGQEALRQTQKLESLGVLAGGIAHDFNNLLTAILGNLNLAQMHLSDQAPAQAYLAKMETTVLRATELTKQMLAYSGRGHFVVQPRDLNQVVREVTHLLEVSISKKVQLRFDLAPALPAIQADAAQLQQVIMNLVTNASDAIGDQDGVIRLRTCHEHLAPQELRERYRMGDRAAGPFVLLEVEDTGCGMSAPVLERIFDPFFTTKTAGRGLGLSAMQGILRGHGAGLWIESEMGRGTCFHLCFPASEQPAEPVATTVDTRPLQSLQGRVLLVDDEDLILETTGAALTALGLEVLLARDGMEALERFREHRQDLDLVLMDLTMPRMDGREAFQAMHAEDPRIPVILSSGFTEQDSLQTLTGEGPAAFMQKPYQIKELSQLLQRVLKA